MASLTRILHVDLNSPARLVGISGVPYFEIYLADNPDTIQQFSGAQPINTFVAIFNRLRVVAKV